MDIFEWWGERSLPVKLGIVIALGTPFLVSSLRREAQPQSSGVAQSPEQSTTATATAGAIEFRSLDFPDVREATGSPTTDEHFALLTQAFGDKRVRWSGWVSQVVEASPGVREVLVDMDGAGVSNGIGVLLALPGEPGALRPGEPIAFEGTITSFVRVESRTFIRLANVTID